MPINNEDNQSDSVSNLVAEVPPQPIRSELPLNDKRTKLVKNVREALRALPFHFESKTVIAGLDALDLFSLNSVLGGTIEIQTVATLNHIRNVWDPDSEWVDYGFERSSQTFPDVRLVKTTDGSTDPVLGIELKGWYLLAKEGQPSFRYTATRDACTIYDLLVVVPWHLGDVLSGAPIVRDPFIEQARYAAEYRNYYWQHMRGGDATNNGIQIPGNVKPYPAAKTSSSDKAEVDRGNNFGRVARIQGLMTEYMARSLNTSISGIEARYWIEFFKVFADSSNSVAIEADMRNMLKRHPSVSNTQTSEKVLELLMDLVRLLNGYSA